EAAAAKAGATHGEKPKGEGGSIAGKTPSKEVAVEVKAEVNPTTEQLLEDGERTMHHALSAGFAWAISIALGFLVYVNGYAITNVLMKIAPLNWIRVWLLRRMYFDELYFGIFVAFVMLASRVSAWFDKYVVDGIVNLAALVVKNLSLVA